MSITVLVELSIEEKSAPAYSERLRAAFPQTRTFDGFEEIIAYQDQQSPGKIFVLERWKSREHYERYLDWRRDQGMAENLKSISSAPTIVRFLGVVA